MLRICSFLVLTLGLAAGPALSAGRLAGPARVIDGDTLVVAGVRVRLFGIDAPEVRQSCKTADGAFWACGVWARQQVSVALRGRKLSCRAIARDRYGRTVARCRVGGRDIGQEFVRAGIAFAYRHYSVAYVGDEGAARLARLGVWRGSAEKPWNWRHHKALTGVVASAGGHPKGCMVKGNISRNGRIYHLPGSRWYDRTRIDLQAGERWFCSAADARAAGWRQAGG